MMLNWLKRLFRCDFGFAEKERLIWQYFDGERTVLVDPIEMWKRVMDLGPVLAADVQLARSISKDAVLGQKRVREHLEKIFRVRPLIDGFEIPPEGSLTYQELSDVLDDFMLFAERLKKNSSKLAISAEEASPNGESSSDDAQPIPNGLDSGSTANVNPIVGNGPLPKASELVLATSPLD